MTTANRLTQALFALRITVFLVMFMWTIDKFINPDHAAAVYKHFYFIGGMGATMIMVIGIAELLILFGFLLGIQKTFTYGAVLLFHTVSTLSTYKQYFDPFTDVNLLFFAAWPMLAACYALFILRDSDTLASFGKPA